jgi:FkbM family methyltransferase
MPFDKIPEQDMWQYLSSAEKPIILYGMGNGADKIIAELERRGIHYDGIFASDSFVRGQVFHGMTVKKFSDFRKLYGSFIVLVCFASSLPEVIENVKRISCECELYIPDVPVCGDNIFDLPYFISHRAELESFYFRLEDAESRSLLENIVYFKLTGALEYLENALSGSSMPYSELGYESWTHAVDAGAYVGDTALEMLSFAPRLERVICIEPDPKTYQKLLKSAALEPRIIPINAAVSDFSGQLEFNLAGGRGARRGGGRKSAMIDSLMLDSLELSCCDYIKYDVEGEESAALAGSAETIKKFRPDITLSLYHRSEDLFALPAELDSILPGCKMYLKRKKGFPAWDIDLICTYKT